MLTDNKQEALFHFNKVIGMTPPFMILLLMQTSISLKYTTQGTNKRLTK
jgi:hypothetical protein